MFKIISDEIQRTLDRFRRQANGMFILQLTPGAHFALQISKVMSEVRVFFLCGRQPSRNGPYRQCLRRPRGKNKDGRMGNGQLGGKGSLGENPQTAR